MASNTYGSLVGILKELYQDENPEDRVWREFNNKCKAELGLPQELSPGGNYLNELVYSDNPLLKMIPKDVNQPPIGNCQPCTPTPLIYIPPTIGKK